MLKTVLSKMGWPCADVSLSKATRTRHASRATRRIQTVSRLTRRRQHSRLTRLVSKIKFLRPSRGTRKTKKLLLKLDDKGCFVKRHAPGHQKKKKACYAEPFAGTSSDLIFKSISV